MSELESTKKRLADVEHKLGLVCDALGFSYELASRYSIDDIIQEIKHLRDDANYASRRRDLDNHADE